LEGGQVNEVLL